MGTSLTAMEDREEEKEEAIGDQVLSAVRKFIAEQQLFPPKTPLLLACSGGLDSMTAFHILTALGYPIGIAHCNFRLRGEESDEDESFVRAQAEASGSPYFSESFDTETEAGSAGTSTQETARNLRYPWLETVRKANGYHFVVTAHHLDDLAETVVFHMARQTGLRGLRGIPPKRDKVVRPLLSLRREQIAAYARHHNLKFREDSSNASLGYSRNYIRHEIMPKLHGLNPNAVEAIDALSRKAGDAVILMDERIAAIRRKLLRSRGETDILQFRYILQHPAGRTLMYELLKPYGFDEERSAAVFEGLSGEPGGEYLSESHRAIRDRKALFIAPLDAIRVGIRRYASVPEQIVFNDWKIQVRTAPVNKVNIRRNLDHAYFDAEELEGALTIRYWKAGDYFYPFGMTRPHSGKPGKKKLSKYFKDVKLPVPLKDEVPVLFSGDHLIWLVGQRSDHRFRVTEDTKIVLKMKVLKKPEAFE